jgi:hypothetical protein
MLQGKPDFGLLKTSCYIYMPMPLAIPKENLQPTVLILLALNFNTNPAIKLLCGLGYLLGFSALQF